MASILGLQSVNYERGAEGALILPQRARSRRRPRSQRKRRRRSLSSRHSTLNSRARARGFRSFSELRQATAPGASVQGLSQQQRATTGATAQNSASKWRGKVTFWNDLEASYFQRLSTEAINDLLDGVRGQDSNTGISMSSLQPALSSLDDEYRFNALKRRGSQAQASNPHLDEFFSFYGHYQDVVNELQDNCNYQDEEEVEVLRSAKVLDQHVRLAGHEQLKTQEDEDCGTTLGLRARSEYNQIEPAQVNLFGYQLQPAAENENYSTDFFSSQMNGEQPSKEIDDQLKWLEQELKIVQRQVDHNVGSLMNKIRQAQKTEEKRENQINSKANARRMSEHFAQAVLHMSMMQLAESVERIKGVRQGVTLSAASIKDRRDYDDVPYALRQSYNRLLTNSPKTTIPFNGKEFLLSFDPEIGLGDIWVDAAQFYLINELRSDMARRQNFGRGLPIQLSKGYRSEPILDIAFDIDKRGSTASVTKHLKNQKSKGQSCKLPQSILQKEASDNIFTELELEELQQLQVLYGHEDNDLRFCHHCKQFKRKVIFAKCNFDSSRHKMIYPASIQVNGVKIYKAEGFWGKQMDAILLKKLVRDKKRRRTYEEQLQVRCQQHYCSLCLKNFYDLCVEEVKLDQDWVCPHCTGACFCSRCRRKEQLTTAQAYLVSLNLSSLLYAPSYALRVFDQEYQKSRNKMDQHIKESFLRVVQSCDLAQANQTRLSVNQKVQELITSKGGRQMTHFFTDATQSTSSQINQIISRNLQLKDSLKSALKRQGKLAVTRDDSESSMLESTEVSRDRKRPLALKAALTTPQTESIEESKETKQLRKRLHHEFRSMLNEERLFCRQAQSNAASQLQGMTNLCQPSQKTSPSKLLLNNLTSDQWHSSEEDKDQFKDTQDAIKRSNLKTATEQPKKRQKLASNLVTKGIKPLSARSKPNKAFGKRPQIRDFKVPLSRQQERSSRKENDRLSSASSRKQLRNNSKDRHKTHMAAQIVSSNSSTVAPLRVTDQSSSQAPIPSHHSTGSTSPSQASKQAVIITNGSATTSLKHH